MTNRERVLAAIAGEKVDRVPVGFWFHFTGEKTMGQPCVQAHLDYYNNYDVDIVKMMCDGYFDYPNPVAKNVKEAKDWYAMKPLGKDSPFVREQVERAKAVKAGLKRDMLVLYNVFAPFSTLRFGTSDELVTRHMKEDPDAIAYALDVVAQDNAILSELLITEAGIDGLYYCLQGGEEYRMSHEEYRAKITPSDCFVLDHANQFTDKNVIHCCGWAGDKNRLENWQDYPCAVFNWANFIEGMDMVEGKKFFGKTVLGGFDNRPQGVLYSGTKEEVMDYTTKLLDKIGTQGVILGADCTLPADVDISRVNWVLEAVKNY